MELLWATVYQNNYFWDLKLAVLSAVWKEIHAYSINNLRLIWQSV